MTCLAFLIRCFSMYWELNKCLSLVKIAVEVLSFLSNFLLKKQVFCLSLSTSSSDIYESADCSSWKAKHWMAKDISQAFTPNSKCSSLHYGLWILNFFKHSRCRAQLVEKKELLKIWLTMISPSISRHLSIMSFVEDIVSPLLHILSPPSLRPVSAYFYLPTRGPCFCIFLENPKLKTTKPVRMN